MVLGLRALVRVTKNGNSFVIKRNWINVTKFVWWPDHCSGLDTQGTPVEYTFTCTTEAKLFNVSAYTVEYLITYLSFSQIFDCFSCFPNSHRLLAPFAKKWLISGTMECHISGRKLNRTERQQHWCGIIQFPLHFQFQALLPEHEVARY